MGRGEGGAGADGEGQMIDWGGEVGIRNVCYRTSSRWVRQVSSCACMPSVRLWGGGGSPVLVVEDQVGRRVKWRG